LHHEVLARSEQPPAWIIAILFPTQISVNRKPKEIEEEFEKPAASTYRVIQKKTSQFSRQPQSASGQVIYQKDGNLTVVTELY
jgi:hypothetical protein